MLLDWIPAFVILGFGIVFVIAYLASNRATSESVPATIGSEMSLVGDSSMNASGQAIGDLDRQFRNLSRGTHSGLDATSMAILMIGSGLVIGFMAYLWDEQPLAFIAGALVGMLTVWTALMLRAAYIRSKVVEQTPNVINMLASTLRAGMSVESGLKKVASKTHGVLGTELRQCSERAELGYATSDTLLELAQRYRVVDLKLVASAVAVHRETGGNLSEVMDRLSTVARERLAYNRQIGGLTLSARAAALIVGSVAPGLLLYYSLFGSGFLSLWDDPSGRFLLLLAGGFELVGILWIFSITRSPV